MDNVRPDRDVKLDDIDRGMLRILESNARTSNRALAESVNVAPSTALLRVRRLEESGVIRGYRADLDPARLGYPIQAIVAIRLRADARRGIASYATKLAALPGVLNVFFLAGANDFQVQVAARSADDLRDFVATHLSASPQVAATETSLIFEHIQAGADLL
jgi:DNA-binding Lrp family transcriptional regulator